MPEGDSLVLDFGMNVLEGLEDKSQGLTSEEQKLMEVADKQEDQLTEEEKALLIEQKDAVEKLKARGSKESKETEELGAVESFMKEEGFLSEGKFEDSVDGLKTYVSERDKKRDLAVLGSFLQANPEIAKIYDHVVVNNKPIESYLKQIEKPEILSTEVKSLKGVEEDQKKDIVDTHIKLIKASLSGSLSEKMIDATIKVAIETGETEELAKDALAKLQSGYDKEVAAIEKQAIEQRKQEEASVIAAINNVKVLVTKGILASDVVIPEAEKKGFIDFLTVPIDPVTKQTKYNKVLESFTQEEDMLLDYMVYLKAKNGKIDIKNLNLKATTKFFKGAKDQNDSRVPKGTGFTPGKTSSISGLPDRFEF